MYDDRDYPDDFDTDFADPGGRSALRAACKERNRLTRKDKALGYRCDVCADQTERGGH